LLDIGDVQRNGGAFGAAGSMTLAGGRFRRFEGGFGFIQLGLARMGMALLTPPVSAGALGIKARARLKAVAAALTSPFCRYDLAALQVGLGQLALVLHPLRVVRGLGLQGGQLSSAVASSLLARFCSSCAMAAARAAARPGRRTVCFGRRPAARKMRPGAHNGKLNSFIPAAL
jgi:hypothetical protein